jgi:hypothetical protein
MTASAAGHQAVPASANHRTLMALPAAPLGAVLSGGVLGARQWLVIQPLRPR